MNIDAFIEPKSVTVGGRECLISKIPAFTAKPVYAEMVLKLRDLGEIGKTMLSDESVRTLLRFTAVRDSAGEMKILDTSPTIEKLLPDHRDFLELQIKQQDHNFSFLSDGSLRNLLDRQAGAEAESV